MTSGLTCVSCHVVFSDPLLHKNHFQTDWHRFNIHRNLENEPPVTEEVFLEKVVPVVKARQDAKRTPSFTCDLCRKQFFSDAALKNHMNSRKHKSTSEATISEEDENLEAKVQAQLAKLHLIDPKVECIFCSNRFPDFESVMEHMTQAHSLFIPDLEYLEDLPGLVKFLAEKVSIEFKCLYCSSPSEDPSHFHSLASVRNHMIDKSHTKIRFDEEGCAELAPFYNWQDLYSDDQYDNEEEEEVWEDVSDSDGNKVAPNRASKPLLISPDGSEMLLPNGSFIGNRELRKYYKQHLRPLDSNDGAHEEFVGKLIRDYRQMGQQTALVPSERKLLERSQRNSHYEQSDTSLAVSRKANKLQPHFRAQIR